MLPRGFAPSLSGAAAGLRDAEKLARASAPRPGTSIKAELARGLGCDLDGGEPGTPWGSLQSRGLG